MMTPLPRARRGDLHELLPLPASTVFLEPNQFASLLAVLLPAPSSSVFSAPVPARLALAASDPCPISASTRLQSINQSIDHRPASCVLSILLLACMLNKPPSFALARYQLTKQAIWLAN
jgi:hypothetical protein